MSFLETLKEELREGDTTPVQYFWVIVAGTVLGACLVGLQPSADA